MNRAALLLVAALTGLGAAIAIYLGFADDDGFTVWRAARATAAAVVFVAALATWRELVRPGPDPARVLKRTALVALAIGVAGLAANAFVGGRTGDPDGPVFVISLLLILQAFLTIAHAAGRE